MRHTWLQLVSDAGTESKIDDPTGSRAGPATAQPVTRRLRLMAADEGVPPDDAA
jgi:hypothetical protein